MVMHRNWCLTLGALGVLALAACGGDEGAEAPGTDAAPPASAVEATPAGQPVQLPDVGVSMRPDWFRVDDANGTAHLTLTAGSTPAKNYWNYNGYHDGNAVVTVPEGYSVTIDLVNQDPSMPHSVGVSDLSLRTSAAPPAEAVFAGAITPNPTSMIDGTMPGQEATITFTAERAGTYALLCYIPGHAATGMWIYFVVTPEAESAGVQEAL
jgi:sulfocyanin